MPLEERKAAVEAGCYCWVIHRRWNHLCRLSLPTHQHQQLTNRENPGEGGPLSAWCTEPSQASPLNTSCQRLDKDSNSVLSPAPMTAVFPVYLTPPGSPQSKQPHYIHTRSSLQQRCQRLESPNNTIFPVPKVPGFPVHLTSPGSMWSMPPPHTFSLWQTQVFQGNLRSKLLWMTHKQVGGKLQLSSMDGVYKEENLKPFHQLYKLEIKSIWSTR